MAAAAVQVRSGVRVSVRVRVGMVRVRVRVRVALLPLHSAASCISAAPPPGRLSSARVCSAVTSPASAHARRLRIARSTAASYCIARPADGARSTWVGLGLG